MSAVVPAQAVPFVRRVRVKNYRSIAGCDVSLGPLTVLLGFNASGKSNFLDVLRFVADALTSSPQKAVANRGGLVALLHRNPNGVADSFEIRLDLALRPGHPNDQPVAATYGFEIAPGSHRGAAAAGTRGNRRAAPAERRTPAALGPCRRAHVAAAAVIDGGPGRRAAGDP